MITIAQDVLEFLHERLGETEVHLLGHGFGGVVVMEAVLRVGLWGRVAPGLPSNLRLPGLSSICLMGTPSSTGILRAESCRLFKDAQKTAGRSAAASQFWQRHFCSGVDTLAEAYMATAWQPWNHWLMRGWEIRREEVARRYIATTGGVPFLSLRGENDFVTARCIEAWRGVEDALSVQGHGLDAVVEVVSEKAPSFIEEEFSSCGHNAHLEDPEVCTSLIHKWFLRVELPFDGHA